MTPRATGPQISYLRRLLNEAFSLHVDSPYDVHHFDERITRTEASAEIDRLKTAIAAKRSARFIPSPDDDTEEGRGEGPNRYPRNGGRN